MRKSAPRMPDAAPADGLDRTPGGKILARCAECGERQAAAVIVAGTARPLCERHYYEYFTPEKIREYRRVERPAKRRST